MIERASRCHPSGLRFHDGHLYQYLDAGSSSVTPRISRMAASGGNEDVPLSILDVEHRSFGPSPTHIPGSKMLVRLTDLTLSCAAKAYVPKPRRRAGCRQCRAETEWRTATGVTPPRWR